MKCQSDHFLSTHAGRAWELKVATFTGPDAGVICGTLNIAILVRY
jgi:hypothetical protein